MLVIVELKVRVHCKACEKALRKELCRIKGVRCVDIDVILNKITVVGYMDRKHIVRAVRKTGRRAEIWPSSSTSSCRQLPQHPTPNPTWFRCFSY